MNNLRAIRDIQKLSGCEKCLYRYGWKSGSNVWYSTYRIFTVKLTATLWNPIFPV